MTALTDITPENIDALIAFHREHFGDARMEGETEENNGGESSETPPEGKDGEQKPADKPEGTEGTEGTEGEQKPETKPEDELPDWAKKELSRVRGEAANWRTQLREAQDALGKAKTPEEFEAATSELASKVTELEGQLMRSTVARKYELPDELAARLRGDTEEELEKDAKTLQKLIAPAAPESLGGGLTPNGDDDDEMDPRKLARRTRRR